MTLASALVPEMEMESHATRRVLERVPEAHLAWRPHPKSYSLGQMSLHVARIPGEVSKMLTPDELQLSSVSFELPGDRTKAEILATFEQALADGTAYLAGLDDRAFTATWRLLHGAQEIMAMPRAAAIRMIMMNHLYHHRGQLLVYLRQLEVPVPAVYGGSADENPFAEALARG